MKQQIIDILLNSIGNDYLYISNPILLPTSLSNNYVSVWGVCVSPSNELYVMDGENEWWIILGTDEKQLTVLLKRVQQTFPTVKTAAI